MKLEIERDEKCLIVYGHRFPYQRIGLDDLAERIDGPRRTMVEVGSLVGWSTRIWLNHFENVTSVDPYHGGYHEADANSSQDRLDVARAVFVARFMDEPRLRQMQMPSWEAVESFEAESQDFVYLDGDHRYQAVKGDIERWWPAVRTGGYMGGDDWHMPSVVQAVTEAFGDPIIVPGDPNFVANRWLVKKS